jgi:cysteinyl-tRNA synthetase
MGLRYLGADFEVHTGGIDNVFPHHEDEIAQSSPVTGGPPARHWVHGEHLLAAGRKMAKSTGNFERITELRDRGIDPLAFRYLALTVRYGRKLNYSETSIDAAAAALRSLRALVARLGPAPSDGPWAAPVALRAGFAGDRPAGIATGTAGHQADPVLAAASRAFPVVDRAATPAAPLSATGKRLHDRFVTAIDDDLDLPTALATVRETLRSDLTADERRWLVLDADLVLGLDLDLPLGRDEPGGAGAEGGSAGDQPPGLPEGAEDLLRRRDAARATRDWATADTLRAELAAMGVEVVDGTGGTTWRRVSG